MKVASLLSSALVFSSLTTVGCAEIPTDTGVSLSQPVTVMTSASPTVGKVEFGARGGTVDELQRLDFTVMAMHLLAHTEDGVLQLDDLALELGDITVSPEVLPPSGLQLSTVEVGLSKVSQSEAVAATPGTLDTKLEVPVTLRADLVLGEGKTYPLGPVAVRPLDSTLSLRSVGGTFSLVLDAKCPGACWDVPGVVDFRDGAIRVEIPATVTNN